MKAVTDEQTAADEHGIVPRPINPLQGDPIEPVPLHTPVSEVDHHPATDNKGINPSPYFINSNTQ